MDGRSGLGFIVPQDRALEILKYSAPGAAHYWRQAGYPKQDQYFAFGQDEAEILDNSVRMPVIHEVREEDLGHRDR